MRRILIAFGALGGGTALAFTLAGIAFLAGPEGRLVPVGMNDSFLLRGQGVMVDGGWAVAPDVAPGVKVMPVPMPAVGAPAERAVDLPQAVEEDVAPAG